MGTYEGVESKLSKGGGSKDRWEMSECVCVDVRLGCVHGSDGHTLRRQIEGVLQRAHRLLRTRDRSGDEEGAR